MLALKRVDCPPIHEWDHIYASQWIEEIGFPEFSNIIRTQKISGLELLDADDDYFYDNLGSSKPDKIKKIKTEISKAK